MSSGSPAEFAITIATSVVGSGALWGSMQWFLTRHQRQEQDRKDARLEVKERDDIERREVDRRELLAKAQSTAQRAALESADKRYGELEKDYEKCRTGLLDLSQATGLLIDVFEKFLSRLRPNGDPEKYTTELDLNEIGEVRRGINEARRHLR